MGRSAAAFAGKHVPVAMGMVHHLLRIRRGEGRRGRSRVAASDRDGRVLPERAAADMDRLVRATSSALVSYGHDPADPCGRAGPGVDAVPATALSHCVFSDYDAV